MTARAVVSGSDHKDTAMDESRGVVRLVALSALLVFGGGSLSAVAQAYPTKPIRFVVPAPPGGGTDTVARIVGHKLSSSVGQPVVVDNRAGASGNIAARLVADAIPDGYTLFVVFASHATNPSLFKDLGYDPIKDFSAITRLTGLPYLLIVHPSLPVKNVKELVALAKSTKGGLTYASGGAGLTGHLAEPGAGYAFTEFSLRHGDFAACAVAVIARAGCLRVAVGGVADRPVARNFPALDGSSLDDALNEFAWALDARDDPLVSAAARRQLVRTLGRRAVAAAIRNAGTA